MMRRSAVRDGISILALSVGLGFPATLHAQETGSDEPVSVTSNGDAASDGDEDVIVVTATGTNISGVKQVGSETFVLSRDDVLASGKSEIADVLKTLPQVHNVAGTFNSASSGGSGNATAGSNATRGTAINLRGVGQGGTLTLVNGHRITPSGTAGAFTEANQIPFAALERVEVIADGASAIYGSDAIAGVINYVLRKDFTGVELSGRYTAGAYGNDEWALSGVAGVSWDSGIGSGSLIATYEHGYRSPYVRGRNARLRQDQRAFGGQDNRVVDGNASVPINGNIVIPTVGDVRNPNFPQGGAFTYYALPMNPNGDILTLADLQEVQMSGCANAATPTCAAYPNVVDRSDFEDYLGEQTRDQAAIFFEQDFGSVEIYDEFFWTKVKQVTRTFVSQNQNANVTVAVAPGSPYYIAGLPNTVRSNPFFLPPEPQPLTVQYNLLDRVDPNGPRFQNDNPSESFNNSFGLRAGLFGDWRGEVYYTYGQNEVCGVCYLGNYISADTGATDIFGRPIYFAGLQNALQNAIDADPSLPYAINPFSTAPLTEAQLDYILGTNSQYSQNYSHDVVAKVDGSLFDLPGGTVKAAFGGEYYFGIQKLQNAANRPPDPGSVTTPDADARTTRRQWAVFAEAYLPLIGPEQDIPLIQEFVISAAVRHDDYSDFGSTTNPKISGAWQVFDDLGLRGSWGTSFRAPGLPELNSGVFSVGIGFTVPVGAGVTDIPNTNGVANTLFIIGNNPNLVAETGENWQIGFDYKPAYVPGLTLSATYYDLSYRNKFGGSGVNPFTAFSTAENRDIYSSFIYPLANSPACSNSDPSTFDPAALEFYDFLYAASAGFDPRDICGADVIVDGRFVGSAEAFQRGLDANLTYFTSTGIGNFSFNLGVNHILENQERLELGSPLLDRLDESGTPVSWRGRGSITYSTGGLSATLFGNYVGGYRNTAPITIQGVTQPEIDVPAWTTFDLNLGYRFDDGGILGGTRLSATVTNVFNNDPPVVHSTISGSSSIDLFAHNAFGRYVQFQVTKSF